MGGDVTLLQAIADGTIPKPTRCTWHARQLWRKDPQGGRRATKTSGSTRPSTTAEESKLWQEVMPKLYGSGWLSEVHGEEDEEAEEPGPPFSRAQGTVFPCAGGERL